MKGRSLISLVLSLGIINSCFAIDPIRWLLTNTFPDRIVIGGLSPTVRYAFINEMPVPLVHPLIIRIRVFPLNSTEFTVTDNCSFHILGAYDLCTVNVELVAQTPGLKEIQLSIAGYSKNVVPLPTLFTRAERSRFNE